ncbi:hypothetical protein DFJ74DRAFT_712878 [Hyaloraphidium curvatum]|nr:hypothetical protein DFJ74DRAFT_712878 [Hyaloraphidium curvatum]
MRAPAQPSITGRAARFLLAASLAAAAFAAICAPAAATSFPPVILPPESVPVWNNGTAPTIGGGGLAPNGIPLLPLQWRCMALCPENGTVRSVFVAQDANGGVRCAGGRDAARTGRCSRYNGATCGGRARPPAPNSYQTGACQRYDQNSWCLGARQVLVLGRPRPICTIGTNRAPVAPGPWRCIAPCAWRNTASLFVRRGANGTVQCAGPNGGACTWYQSTNCGGRRGPPAIQANGMRCASYVPGTWCTDGYQVVIGGRAAPACGAVRGGTWRCLAPCYLNGNRSVFVTVSATGTISCAGRAGDRCDWYVGNRCAGLTAPPATSASGASCFSFAFGTWCFDARQILTANLPAPTCQAPAANSNWRCIAPCAYSQSTSIFVTQGADGNVRCAGTGGNCRWYQGATCAGNIAPSAAESTGGFGCAGYVVGNWCYDGREVLTRGLSAPTCTAPGEWQCITPCDNPGSSMLVHALEDGNIQCASSSPGGCTTFPGTGCSGMSAPPHTWNANGQVCAEYHAPGWCRDAWLQVIAKTAPAGCAQAVMPALGPARPGVRPSRNWNFVLGPYGLAPNNVDRRYSNFFHVTPDSVLPSIRSRDGLHWIFFWTESENHRSIGTGPYVENQWTLNPRRANFGGRFDGWRYDNGGKWLMHVQRVPTNPTTLVGFYHAQDNYWPRTCPACECWKSIGVAYSYDEGITWTDAGQIITAADPRPPDSAPRWGGNGDFGVAWDWWERRWKLWYGGEYWLSMAVSSDPEGRPGTWRKWGGPNVGFNVPGLGGRGFPVGGTVNADGSFNWDRITGLALAPGANPHVHFNTYLNKWVMVWHGWNFRLYISASDDGLNWESPRLLATSINNSRAWYPTVVCATGGSLWGAQWCRLYYGDNWAPNTDRRDFVSRTLQFVRYD